jgi:iron complex transport system ATP-binding protein
MPLFETQNLSFRYPTYSTFELHSTDLSVQKGDLVGLLGPNGAGKSTLLKLMAGLLPPRTGRILFEERPLENIPVRERARKIAYVPQSLHFTFPLSVLEVVEMGRHPHVGRFEPLGTKDREVCDRALGLCDALNFKNRLYEELSGGEKQRVLLASALAQTPQVLLLDEPTLSLDLSHQILLFEIIRKLHREENLTVVVATHELNMAGRYMDRLVLMKEGKILADGQAKIVLTPETIQILHGVQVVPVKLQGEMPYFIPGTGYRKKKVKSK